MWATTRGRKAIFLKNSFQTNYSRRRWAAVEVPQIVIITSQELLVRTKMEGEPTQALAKCNELFGTAQVAIKLARTNI